jgi:hypothetical protein
MGGQEELAQTRVKWMRESGGSMPRASRGPPVERPAVAAQNPVLELVGSERHAADQVADAAKEPPLQLVEFTFQAVHVASQVGRDIEVGAKGWQGAGVEDHETAHAEVFL